MTARIIVSCDSDWHGFPCRGFHSTPTETKPDAYTYVWARGWTFSNDVGDLCPSCTRKANR